VAWGLRVRQWEEALEQLDRVEALGDFRPELVLAVPLPAVHLLPVGLEAVERWLVGQVVLAALVLLLAPEARGHLHHLVAREALAANREPLLAPPALLWLEVQAARLHLVLPLPQRPVLRALQDHPQARAARLLLERPEGQALPEPRPPLLICRHPSPRSIR